MFYFEMFCRLYHCCDSIDHYRVHKMQRHRGYYLFTIMLDAENLRYFWTSFSHCGHESEILWYKWQAIELFNITCSVADYSRLTGILEGFSGTSSSIQTFIFSTLINYYTGIWVSKIANAVLSREKSFIFSLFLIVQNIEELWKMVFLFTALYAITTNIIFLIFGTSDVQNWNFDHVEQPIKAKNSNDINIGEKRPIFKAWCSIFVILYCCDCVKFK